MKIPPQSRAARGLAALAVIAFFGGFSGPGLAVTDAEREFFESKIRPVLAQDCYECHSTAGKKKGGLVLDHREALLAGGDSGAVVVPGDADGSLLMRAIRHEDEDLAMPKAGAKLEEGILENFAKWIAMGAPDPRDGPPSAEEVAADTDWKAVMERRKQWWSFQPIVKPAVPEVQEKGWSEHPVDRFLQARQEEAGLARVEDADGRTLGRRLYFVLTGLPPTGEEIEAFAKDWEKHGDAATEKLVDALLASPHFGERWARHWMDWIRYAESHGSEGDPLIENAWQYRDYLIRALNADVPYDQLVREHLAGDLMGAPRVNAELGINESAIGPAHWRMVFHGFAPTDALDEKVRFTDDEINVFSKTFLGLTVSCARCHDHKFDAISQADYYALFGIFGSTRPGRIAIDLPGKRATNRGEMAALKPQIREAVAKEWLAAAPEVVGRLMEREAQEVAGKKGKGKAPAKSGEAVPASSVLEPWDRLRDLEGDVFGKAWANEAAKWEEVNRAWEEHEGREYWRRWDLARAEDYASWFANGDGLPEVPEAAGAFAVGVGEEGAIAGIFPAGVYSHGLSTKHGATLSSPEVHLAGEYDLWLRITGGGAAMARYVVQNYPRSGTVFRVTELKDDAAGEWRWQRFDLDYWKGDEVHVELTTAKDAAVLTKDSPRSWFGIREAVFVKKDEAGPPAEPVEFLGPVFEEAKKGAPDSAEALAALYGRALAKAIEGWRKGDLSDGQAVFLNAMLREEMLPNGVDELGAAGGLIAAYRELEKAVPEATRVPGLIETVAFDQALFDRGDHKKPGELVPRRFLEAIDDTPYKTELSGRAELAEDLLRPDNPFTRRVIVNRLWHHVFGEGIVTTTDNFGRMGATPSHPELLDYLALRFEEEGWSLKMAIRLLVTSRTFALASEVPRRVEVLDPENRLLTHAPVRRLEAEAIRDGLLAVSGELLREDMYGPSVAGEAPRRSVYVNVIRNRMDPFLTTFDAPVPASPVGRREVTNVPGQSLTMLNSEFVRGLAAKWGERITADQRSDEVKLKAMWAEAFGREPTAEEIDGALRFLKSLEKGSDEEGRARVRLENELKGLREELRRITEPVRARLLAEIGSSGKASERPAVEPIGWWKFDENLEDCVGDLDGEFVGDARLEDGALVVGAGFVATPPLKRSLGEKTLEVLVLLDDLGQRGGGAMGVQDLRGGQFDSIVFAEKTPLRWLAGSNTHQRTLSFEGQDEMSAATEPVWVAIAYDQDGLIRGYRDGEPYGQGIRKSELVPFERGEAQVVFGIRHGTRPDGKRLLRGRILEARLYDRALTEEEVAASASGTGSFVSWKSVLAALSVKERAEAERLEGEVERCEEALEKVARPAEKMEPWGELAHSLFNFKEFIYLK